MIYLAYDSSNLHKQKIKRIIECKVCTGRSYIEINTNGLKQKICAFCFMRGEIKVLQA